jgi:hypothetical protein
MGASNFGSNTTLKVNRAITGSTTVNSNCYAVITYQLSNVVNGSPGAVHPAFFTNYYGPGQSVPASYTLTTSKDNSNNPLQDTYTLVGGVEFINSP